MARPDDLFADDLDFADPETAIIEVMARGIAEAFRRRDRWEKLSEHARNEHREEAKGALSQLSANGFEITTRRRQW